MLSEKLLVKVFLLLALSSCANYKIADIRPTVTLPASKDCFGITIITLKEFEMPKAECDEFKKRAVFLSSEDWKKLKVSILENCQLQQCKQLVGVFDSIFLTIDEALQKIPNP